MRKNNILHRIIWVIPFSVLCLTTVAQDDLADFDFKVLKEIEWNYDNDQYKEQDNGRSDQSYKETLVKFDKTKGSNRLRPFDWREKVLRTALSKALTDSILRQKFVEVMPILRVLSTQQRLALSGLISAQINVNVDQSLKLEQVRVMFGNDKKLLLPIVYDIANLVRNSAEKYLYYGFNTSTQQKQQAPIDRRLDIISSKGLVLDSNNKKSSNLPIPIDQGNNELSIEDVFSETYEEILDPQSINEELQESVRKLAYSRPNTTLATSKKLSEWTNIKRSKRSATSSEFVHKLVRSIPLSGDADGIHYNVAGNMIKLNTSGFFGSKDFNNVSIIKSTNTVEKTFLSDESSPTTGDKVTSTNSYQQIEDAAFSSFNVPITDFENSTESSTDGNVSGEELPIPEELTAGPRYRIANKKLHNSRPIASATKRKRIQASRFRSTVTPKGIGGVGSNGVATQKKCERFTSSMCIRTPDYPLDQIMGSIRRHKNAMIALWADYQDKSIQLATAEDFDEYSFRRREDDATGGGMCQSMVRYARPQKARSASGEWKYIVNTGKHTQTLRLEKCTKPQKSCSYLAQSYRSHCVQIYNYHRLLSWDRTRGLHVDIFKVPTCCSCQVDGFRQQFSPYSNPGYSSEIYSTINEELDYSDEHDDDEISYQTNNAFNGKYKKHDTGYDNNELLLASQSSRHKLHSPNPTLGSYLKPPGSEEDYETSFEYRHQHIGKSPVVDLSRRRPHGRPDSSTIYNEARVDLDFSPSEQHLEKEVIFSGGSLANSNKRVQQNRQHIHSVPHTAYLNISSTLPGRDGSTISSISKNFYKAPGLKAPATHEATRNRGDFASNAYQTSAQNHNIHRTAQQSSNFSSNFNNFYRNKQFVSRAGKKPKPRFRQAATTTTATFSKTTGTKTKSSHTEPENKWSIYRSQQPAQTQPPVVTPFYINSINNDGSIKIAKVISDNINNVVNDSEGSIRTASGPGPKRVNYSYHPIIDFFATHKNLLGETTPIPMGMEQKSSENDNTFSHTITKSQHIIPTNIYSVNPSHERRIGFGIDGSPQSANRLQSGESAWRPVASKRK